MQKEHFYIDNLPAILWGENKGKLFIVVHGACSNKEDSQQFAEIVTAKGYGVISFDLPEHGERIIKDKTKLRPWICIEEINKVYHFAANISGNISLFATSLGAYMSLLSFAEMKLEKALFLSPIVDLKRIILNDMETYQITEEQILEKKEIPTPVGRTLYDDYYIYVMSHPVEKWNTPTAILYGENDDLCEYNIVKSFADRFGCDLEVMKNGQHWFHTESELKYFSDWVNKIYK